jgi:hypothetical protein
MESFACLGLSVWLMPTLIIEWCEEVLQVCQSNSIEYFVQFLDFKAETGAEPGIFQVEGALDWFSKNRLYYYFWFWKGEGGVPISKFVIFILLWQNFLTKGGLWPLKPHLWIRPCENWAWFHCYVG